MDLYAFFQIKNLGKIAAANGIDIPRLRGYRYMRDEEKVSQDEINEQIEMFNKYVGREDVLCIHSRIGGNNWNYYGGPELEKQPWFLEKIDDYYDDTYCDIYAKIDPVHALQELKVEGVIDLILWTCRSGKDLDFAVDWCRERGLIFDAVNENLPRVIEKYEGDTRKVSADIYIDDFAQSYEGLSLMSIGWIRDKIMEIKPHHGYKKGDK